MAAAAARRRSRGLEGWSRNGRRPAETVIAQAVTAVTAVTADDATAEAATAEAATAKAATAEAATAADMTAEAVTAETATARAQAVTTKDANAEAAQAPGRAAGGRRHGCPGVARKAAQGCLDGAHEEGGGPCSEERHRDELCLVADLAGPKRLALECSCESSAGTCNSTGLRAWTRSHPQAQCRTRLQARTLVQAYTRVHA